MSLSEASFSIEKVSGSRKEVLLKLSGDDCVRPEGKMDEFPEIVDPTLPATQQLSDMLHFLSCAQKEAYQFFGDKMGLVSNTGDSLNEGNGNIGFSHDQEAMVDENESTETTIMNSSEWSRASSHQEKKQNEPPIKKLKIA